MKGRSGMPSLKPSDRTAEPMAAVRAAAALVRFQNMPRRKMTTMPGVKKPVNSWMYWKACSNPPRRGGAAATPMAVAAMAPRRPMRTRSASDVLGLNGR